MPSNNDCAYGAETGRTFIYDDYNTKCVLVEPDHDEWHRWTEYKDEDGDYTYVSDDPDGYVLDAEEFGPYAEDEVIWKYKVGDEWNDGVGNYIIIDVRECEIRTYDFEGCIDWQPLDWWEDLVVEMEMVRVTEPSLEERLAEWRQHPAGFPL